MKKSIIIAVVVAIIATMIGVGIYYLATNNSNKDQAEPQDEYNLMDYDNKENVKIENKTKENNSEELSKEKTFLGLKFTNIKLVGQGGMTSFTADIVNASGKDFAGKNIVVIFKNEDGTEYARLPGTISDVKNGETTKLDASITDDITNAYDFVIEENIQQ